MQTLADFFEKNYFLKFSKILYKYKISLCFNFKK